MTRRYPVSALSLAVALSLAGCGGGNDSNAVPTIQNAQFSDLRQMVTFTGALSVKDDSDLSKLKYSVSENGQPVAAHNGVFMLAHGELRIDAKTATVHYLPYDTTDTTVKVSVSDGEKSSSGNITFSNIAGDPLFAQQWHLRNTGQKAYSQNPAGVEALIQYYEGLGYTEDFLRSIFFIDETVLVPGEDLHLTNTIASGITGKGVKVLVADSGMELGHEDLAPNVIPNASLNFAYMGVDDGNGNTTYPSTQNPMDPTSRAQTGDHGTSVAGLIAAKGWNGKGGRGVAPDAGLMAQNFITDQNNLSYMLSNGIPGSMGSSADIINKSYGADVFYQDVYFDSTDQAVQAYGPTYGRDGKGIVMVKAAGNGFNSDLSAYSPCRALGTNAAGLTCQNTNIEGVNAYPYNTIVAAVDSNGKHTSYSSAGSNVFISAPAGEYGDLEPAMVTTDQSTCLQGYSSFPEEQSQSAGGYPYAQLFPFNAPGHPDNPNCNYTANFNGTSSATPNTAGSVALLLSANPNLTWRDVRYILASTADEVDPNAAPAVIQVNGDNYVARDGWITNAAGFHFNNLYGFGRVDVDKAVAMATNGYKNLPPMVETDWQDADVASPIDIPDNSITGAESTFEVTDDMILETTQIHVTITNDNMVTFNPSGSSFEGSTIGPDTAIELISPSGTRSVLLNPRSGMTISYDAVMGNSPEKYFTKDMVLATNAFYGENAKGTWTIKVLDTNGSDVYFSNSSFASGVLRNNTTDSQLAGWGLRFFGHQQ